MSVDKRLTEVFRSSQEIPFDDGSKFILFSDCHRSNNSWADDFANNQSLFFFALQHYFKDGFTYIELGDGAMSFTKINASQLSAKPTATSSG
jgi:hypothetical protein